jgi:hypothetical protein
MPAATVTALPGGASMTNVTAQMSVSLDGYYAGPRSSTDPRDLPAFMEGSEGPGFFRVTRWVIDAIAWRERQGYTGGERSIDSQICAATRDRPQRHHDETYA